MKISVIIPTFRPQSYLWECLDALRAQTLSANEWEAIIVLNGEEQPYRLQIENYLAQHQLTSWRLLYSSQAGVSNARNLGLQASQGDYICFIDDDDYVSPSYLEALQRLPEYDRKRLYEGNWQFDDDSDKLFNTFNLNQMFRNEIVGDGTFYITGDIARFGRDKTILIVCKSISYRSY